MSINCSDSMTATQYLLESSCSKIKISSFSNRPKPIFENAFVKTSILFFVKDNKNANQILTTKMYRKNDILTIEQIISNFSFVDSLKYKLHNLTLYYKTQNFPILCFFYVDFHERFMNNS